MQIDTIKKSFPVAAMEPPEGMQGWIKQNVDEFTAELLAHFNKLGAGSIEQVSLMVEFRYSKRR